MTKLEVANYLNTELSALFPTNNVKGTVRNVLGETVFLLFTYYTKEMNKWNNNIIENDPAFMHFMISTNRDGSAYIEYPSTHCNKIFYQDALKFRKINGKNEQECAEKLVKWFKKNRELILNVPV